MGKLSWTLGILLLFAATATTAKKAKQPNIILFVGDDVGAADYQHVDKAMRTPNLIKLARRGVVMDQSYTLQACTPTRTALLTGKYPFTMGFHIGKIKGTALRWVNLTHKFLPETLQELNYTTHAIGKWHLGHCHWKLTPTYRGFDSFYGFYSGAQSYFNHSNEDDTAYDFRDNERVASEHRGTYSTDLHTQRAIEIIKKRKKNKPFFIYMAYQNAHAPWEAHERYRNVCSHVQNDTRQTHCAMVAAMDDSIGRITQTLKDEKIHLDTLQIYLSDNGGPCSGEYGSYSYPLRGCKASFWEGGMRSYTIFVYQRKMNKTLLGTVRDSMFHVTDFYKTLVSAAGGEDAVKNLQKMDGIDQFDAILSGRSGQRTRMVYSIDETKNRSAVRIGDLKLMLGKPGSSRASNSWLVPPDIEKLGKYETEWVKGGIPYHKMYNVRTDPSERNNLYGYSAYETEQKELEAFLAQEMPRLVPFPEGEMPTEKLGKPKNYGGIVSPGWCYPTSLCPTCNETSAGNSTCN